MHSHAPGGGLEQGRDDIVDWVAREVLPHEKRVRDWLTRALRDPAEVDDVVQEAYCKLAGLGAVDHIDHGGAYFFATARSIVLQRVRREKTVLIDVARDADLLDSVETEDPSPERVVGARRELHTVLKMIGDLPAAYRRVIELRRLHGHSQKETATILGITENMVENHSTRGLRMILQALAGQSAPDHAGNAPSPGPEIDARLSARH